VQNGTSTGDGGGVRNNGGQLQLANVEITDNDAMAATVGGGGIFTTGGTVTIASSTISGNTAAGAAAGGGGIAVQAGFLTLTNVTVSGNSAPKGGAIYNTGIMSSQGSVSTNNVTITANTSANGAVLTDNGGITYRNTIVGPNSGANCVVEPGGSFVSSGYNLVSDNSCPAASVGDIAETDPQLGALADNGGETMTHALSDTSPAIDAGDDLGCADTDQRGVDRPQGPHCDIGAFELEVPATQGDVDCSGGVNSVDALKVLRFGASLSVVQTEPCPDIGTDAGGLPFGDVDCSTTTNSVDALKILRFNASLSVIQTEPCPDIGQPL
jgi:predicted outer membrane repeat protein